MALATPERSAAQALERLTAGAGKSGRERAFEWLLLAATAVSLVVLAVLLWDILSNGTGRLSLDFLRSFTSRRAEQTGVRAGLTGSLSLMVLTAAVAFPVGVGAAVYFEEHAPRNRLTRLLEANIANLAGVPSVVYGLLGLAVFTYALQMGRSLIAGALTLALLILPVIIVSGREAIRAVPRAIRDGGLALGATPLQVTRRQVLPSALPGIMTGTILALSRAVGETAPLLVVGAVFSRRADTMPWQVFEPFTALPIQVYDFLSRPQEAFQQASAAGSMVLITVLLVMNSAAIVLRNRYARRW